MRNRVQCWLCRNWVAEEHSVKEMFLNKEETVCIMCAQKLRNQDAKLDMLTKAVEDAERNAAALPSEYHGGEGDLASPESSPETGGQEPEQVDSGTDGGA